MIYSLSEYLYLKNHMFGIVDFATRYVYLWPVPNPSPWSKSRYTYIYIYTYAYRTCPLHHAHISKSSVAIVQRKYARQGHQGIERAVPMSPYFRQPPNHTVVSSVPFAPYQSYQLTKRTKRTNRTVPSVPTVPSLPYLVSRGISSTYLGPRSYSIVIPLTPWDLSGDWAPGSIETSTVLRYT